MPPLRRGYTLTEMLIVVGVLSLLALFAMPKFEGLYERSRLASARQEIISAVATARAAAIQKGLPSTFVLRSNRLRVTVEAPGGGQTTVIPATPLDTLFGVRANTSDDSLTFDARGFVTTSITGKAVFHLIGLNRRDSVCMTAAGQIMPRECLL